ncbi:MAG TPA: von Willebrand factor type A domain-containing protein [Verrucomicrobiae bacterium]|nr:von Willebrand factor type A domain-containing protein [Verrucomicrobiae bacterium]
MNPESPIDPRKALEASLTALLLGELSEDQARFLRQAMVTDPELAKTFESLKKTVELVCEVQASPRPEHGGAISPLKLSEARRSVLLQQFKTIRSPVFTPPARRQPNWLVPLAASVALVLVLAGLMLPALSRTKARSIAQPGESPFGHLAQLRRSSDGPPVEPAQQSEERLQELRQHIEPTKQALKSSRLTLLAGSSGQGKQPLAQPEESLRHSGSNIILPGQAQSAEGITSGQHTTDARDVGFYAFDPSANSGAPGTPTPDTFNTFGLGGGLGGAAQAPTLGDAPQAGRLFQVQNKNESAPAAAPALQVETNALSWQYPSGAIYGGGAFGGYSTITTLPPGQPYHLMTIPGVGQVPVLDSRLAEDGEKLGLAQNLGGMSPAPVESDVKLKIEAGKEVVLAKDEPKQVRESEKLARRLERVDGLEESLDKKTGLRAKLAETQLSDQVVRERDDLALVNPAVPPPVPQPEIVTRSNAFSTFSLNVSDVSFKLAAASLEKGALPDPASIRSEEFLNAFDYRDPEPGPGAAVGFASEAAQDPFAQNRDLLRFSIKTAAAGRQSGRPLNLVLLLDNSGSMERADRVQIIREALRVLAAQLHPQDTLSVVTFARTARLWVDGVPGDQAGRIADELSDLTPQGGTNLEEAMNLGYQTALRHYNSKGINRVVLLTDGAANLGDTNAEVLRQRVETNRKQGIALDCFGIGWEGYNDTLLEELTRHGDGRYGFINTPEEAVTGFAGQLAGALQVAASDVKVQVEFNANRVSSYRQIGYAHHQLTKEQFRDNSVDAAEIGAAESGNALYVIETNPQGEGPLATVRVRYKLPGTADYREQEWSVPFSGRPVPLEQTSPAMRLAATSSAFSEWLAQSPFAQEVTPERLLVYLNGVPAVYGADARPQKLEWMIRQAKAISGK